MISSLEQFNAAIRDIRKDSAEATEILFRGQVDSSWMVKSTLERIGIPKIPCSEYYLFIDKIKPLINPFIESKYQRKATTAGYPINFGEYDKTSWSLPELEYLTYLRHHGFPTPIIDWTKSPYVALFFSCEDFATSRTDGKVFVYSKSNAASVEGSSIPTLQTIGEYVETDKRHVAQQSKYLVPIIYLKEWQFITFGTVSLAKQAFYTVKELEIESDAKAGIIRELTVMNINRFTMYLSEDSLIRNYADVFALEYMDKLKGRNC